MRLEPVATKQSNQGDGGCFRDLAERAQLPAKSLLTLSSAIAPRHCPEGCLTASSSQLQQHQHRRLDQSHLLHSF